MTDSIHDNILQTELENEKLLQDSNPNLVHAVFLIITIDEIKNRRFYNFIEKLSKWKPSLFFKIPFFIFLDEDKNMKSISEINLVLDKFSMSTKFSKIEIVNNNILGKNNIYRVNDTTRYNIPEYGLSSGPNLHFYKTINYEVTKYKNVLLLETDCFFIKNNWLDTINVNVRTKNFWIYGSKFYGKTSGNENFYQKHHINGVAVYKRCTAFMEFLNFVFYYIKTNISLKHNTHVNYDLAISNVIDLFNKRSLLIDSPLILNISSPNDKDIRHYGKIKPNVILVHQK
jgi:hypothetical protein